MGLPPPDQHRNRIQMQSCNKKKKKTQKTSLQKRKRNCLKQQHKSTRSKLTSSADADCCCTTVWFHVVTGAGKGWQARTILRICKRDKRTLRKISLAFYIFAPHQQRLLAVLCVKYIVPSSSSPFIVFFFLIFFYSLFFFFPKYPARWRNSHCDRKLLHVPAAHHFQQKLDAEWATSSLTQCRIYWRSSCSSGIRSTSLRISSSRSSSRKPNVQVAATLTVYVLISGSQSFEAGRPYTQARAIYPLLCNAANWKEKKVRDVGRFGVQCVFSFLFFPNSPLSHFNPILHLFLLPPTLFDSSSFWLPI